MEILIEIILEVYLEMMFLIVPEKNVTKKQQLAIKLTAVAVLIGSIALAVWGVVLIADHGNMWGIVPLAVAVVVSLGQIVAGIVLYKKNHG